jgi:hypothetical protein
VQQQGPPAVQVFNVTMSFRKLQSYLEIIHRYWGGGGEGGGGNINILGQIGVPDFASAYAESRVFISRHQAAIDQTTVIYMTASDCDSIVEMYSDCIKQQSQQQQQQQANRAGAATAAAAGTSDSPSLPPPAAAGLGDLASAAACWMGDVMWMHGLMLDKQTQEHGYTYVFDAHESAPDFWVMLVSTTLAALQHYSTTAATAATVPYRTVLHLQAE